MNWKKHQEDLANGKTVKIRPRGNSMEPRIKSGQLVTIEPAQDRQINNGDIVFCKVKSNYYVHLVKSQQRDRFQIGNNKNKINGWISRNRIYGIVTSVDD